MDRQQFDDAIGAAPPSTVDVDAVIASQRRAAVVRRVATSRFSAAAAVVAVTFGIAVALPGSGEEVTPAGPPAPSGVAGDGVAGGATDKADPTALATPLGPSGIAPTAQQPQPCEPPIPAPGSPQLTEPAARYGAALAAAVQAEAPNLQLSPSPGAVYQERQHGPFEFFHVADATICQPPFGYFISYATASDPTGDGEIMAIVDQVFRTSDYECPTSRVQPDLAYCNRQIGPNGEIIVAATSVLADGGMTLHRVDVARPDGTALVLQAQNGSGKFGVPTMVAPPLTPDQLIAIATHPDLTIDPS